MSPPPLAPSQPGPDEVHLWMIPCAGDEGVASAHWPFLSDSERLRASRMPTADARRAFVIGRARVRQVLGAYVGQLPASLDVVAKQVARPRLIGAPSWFDFSFSRCGHLHVCAVGVERRIGVDVEALESGEPGDRPAEARVRRSALVKAAGLGSDWALRVDGQMDGLADVPAGATAAITIATAEGDLPEVWRVRSFSANYAGIAGTGAVASNGEWQLTTLAWTD